MLLISCRETFAGSLVALQVPLRILWAREKGNWIFRQEPVRENFPTWHSDLNIFDTHHTEMRSIFTNKQHC